MRRYTCLLKIISWCTCQWMWLFYLQNIAVRLPHQPNPPLGHLLELNTRKSHPSLSHFPFRYSAQLSHFFCEQEGRGCFWQPRHRVALRPRLVFSRPHRCAALRPALRQRTVGNGECMDEITNVCYWLFWYVMVCGSTAAISFSARQCQCIKATIIGICCFRRAVQCRVTSKCERCLGILTKAREHSENIAKSSY